MSPNKNHVRYSSVLPAVTNKHSILNSNHRAPQCSKTSLSFSSSFCLLPLLCLHLVNVLLQLHMPVCLYCQCLHYINRFFQWSFSSAVSSPCCTTWEWCKPSSVKLHLSWDWLWEPQLQNHYVLQQISLLDRSVLISFNAMVWW